MPPLLHTFLRRHHVVGRTGVRIVGDEGDHAADLKIGIDMVSELRDACCGDHLVMCRLIHRTLRSVEQRIANPGVRPAERIFHHVGLVVDLVERHPIAHLIPVTAHDRLRIADKEVDKLAVCPPAVGFCKPVRHLEVTQCDDGLDAVRAQRIEKIVVESETRLVGRFLVAVWENTRPRNRCAETLKAHLGKERDVLLVRMVKIDARVVRITLARDHAVRNAARLRARPTRHHIADRRPAPVRIPRALELMRRHRAAP